MKASPGVVLAMLAIPCWLFGQTAEAPSEVPAKWLHDGHLTVPEFNFSVASPVPDAHWSYMALPAFEGRKATVFVLDASAQVKCLLVVADMSSVTERFDAKEIIDGIHEGLPEGWQVTDVDSGPSVLPLKGSTRFRAALRKAEAIMYEYGYAAPRTYIFTIFSADAIEPPLFTSFVQSFTLLSPIVNPTVTPTKTEAALQAQTPPPKSTPRVEASSAPQPSPSVSQPFGLKGDVLGETIEEFRARNERVITLGTLGQERAKVDPDLPRTKKLPQCTNSIAVGNLSWDVRELTDEEKRAGVIRCIAALSLDDDPDFEDNPTIANVRAYRTVYYFFHQRLYMIKSTLPASEYPVLRSAFIDKYGTPSVSAAEYQNSFGAKFSGEKLLWENSVSGMSLGQRDGDRDDPLTEQLKDTDVRIRSIKVNTAAIGKGYEATETATVYGRVLQEVREGNKGSLNSSNVLVTIWHNALRKECEAAGAVDRKKDM
jgi:hypothetical protein